MISILQITSVERKDLGLLDSERMNKCLAIVVNVSSYSSHANGDNKN
jgi:hypothetical protein